MPTSDDDGFRQAAVHLFQEVDTDFSGYIELAEFVELVNRLHSMTLPKTQWEFTVAATKAAAMRRERKNALTESGDEAFGKRVSLIEFEDMEADKDGKVSSDE